MAEPGLTAERILNSDTFMALLTLTSTRDYNRIVQELDKLEIYLDRAPFGDGKGEVAARAIHTLDQVTQQTVKRWKFFKRLVGVHRYLIALYLIILLLVSVAVAIFHSESSVPTSIVWWLVIGNLLGLMALGAIAQVDKSTLSESAKIDRLEQKRMELINALRQVQSPQLGLTDSPTRVPIRDEKGQMTLIRHHSLRVDSA